MISFSRNKIKFIYIYFISSNENIVLFNYNNPADPVNMSHMIL